MTERATVTVTPEDIASIEAAGYALYRARESDRALELHALALRLRSQTAFPPAFHCEVDESGGLADVYEINCYSRKVGA